MLRFTLRRVGATVPLLFGVVLFLFVLLELAPGYPVQAMIGDYPVPDGYRERLIEQFHLDASPVERFFGYLGNLVQGDLGYSFANRQSVSHIVLERLPNTLLLVGVG